MPNYACKIRLPKGIGNDQLAYYHFYYVACANILFPFIFSVQISKKTPIMGILARCQFCLLTIVFSFFEIKL